MTSAQSMLHVKTGLDAKTGDRGGRRGPRRSWVSAVLLPVLWAMVVAGCRSDLDTPNRLTSPYADEVLIAVVPFEDRTTRGDAPAERVSERFADELAQVDGVSAIPLARTREAMRSLGLLAVRSPEEAERVASALGVDAVVLGAVSAFDPFRPPVLGVQLLLYRLPDASPAIAAPDPDRIRRAATDEGEVGEAFAPFRAAPVASVSLHLDARDHGVVRRVRRYAEGRTDPESVLGGEAYLESMDLYTRFAMNEAIGRLLDSEWRRLAATRRTPAG